MSGFEISYLTVGQWNNNVYYLISGKDVWLVDPGDDFDALDEMIVSRNFNVLGILLTHGHFDHISSSEKFRLKYGVKISVHFADKRVIRQANLLRKLAGGKGTQVTPQIESDLNTIESLKIGSTDIKIFHTPGHSPGSVCFELGNNLIVGDLFFLDKFGRADLPGGNLTELNLSLELIANRFVNYFIYPGHGQPFLLDEERKENILKEIHGCNN